MRPNAKISAERRRIGNTSAAFAAPLATRERSENSIDMPTMKRNAGNTESAKVKPFHGACSKKGHVCALSPLLLTRIMTATVSPRNTSSVMSRPDGAVVEFMLIVYHATGCIASSFGSKKSKSLLLRLIRMIWFCAIREQGVGMELF